MRVTLEQPSIAIDDLLLKAILIIATANQIRSNFPDSRFPVSSTIYSTYPMEVLSPPKA